MNNERNGWDYKGNSFETKDEVHPKGNKKNNHKFKDGERNYEYPPYRKHPKKNDYNEKGRKSNENNIYKKNLKKNRENNFEITEKYSENIEEMTNEINNHNQQDEIKLKNYNQTSQNNSKKNYYNTNQINNTINNYNINNLNEQNQQGNLNQFFYQENSLNNINYMNNQSNNSQNGIVKNYNPILNPQYRKFNNIKQYNNNNKGKNNNNAYNNTNLNMTKSLMQITNGNNLENQIEQNSKLNIENSQNNISINSDNLSTKTQSYYSNRSCAPLATYGNEIFINNMNQQIPPYINDPMYNFNRIPINIFGLNSVNIEQNNLFNYSPFTMNTINLNQNNVMNNNNDNMKENKKKNNLIGKNKGNRSNQGNKNLIPNHNNNTNLNVNNSINGGIFINQNQNIQYHKKNTNKKLGLRKLNSEKNISINNFPLIPPKNLLNNNKIINQSTQKEEQISPFNNLILKIKLPNGNESIDILNINLLEHDFHNVAQKYVINNNLSPILNETIYNKIIHSLELTNNIFSNNTTIYDRKKLEDLRNYYLNNKEENELNNSIEDILEYNKYLEMIKDLSPNKNEINNFEFLNYTV